MSRSPQKPLTAKQQAFVAQYLVDKNATAAAVRAGYSEKTAAKIASNLMKKPAVRAAVDSAVAKQLERVEVSADEILAGLKRVAFFDIAEAYEETGKGDERGENRMRSVRDMPRDVRDALAGIDVHYDGKDEPGYVVKLKVDGRLKALELLGKYRKLFTEKVEHSGAVSVEIVDPYAEPPKEPKP